MRTHAKRLLACVAIATLAIPCASEAQQQRGWAGDLSNVNTIREDRGDWQRLLSDHVKIRRKVMYTESGVSAETESDDPAIAALITKHARAMEERIKAGARVRVWDPVFAELFNRHADIRLEVTPTERGVRISESSDNSEVVALLWSHAAGVSDFVRHGHESGRRETLRITPGHAPPPEVAIGGVPHRFLLDQPTPAQLATLKATGVRGLLNFRPADERPDYDEAAAASEAGLTYLAMSYHDAADLTDEALDQARAALASAGKEGTPLALHCRTGNRVGPVWAAYRALDQGISLEQAIAEAKAVGMVSAELEAKLRDYIKRRSPSPPDAQ